MEVRKRYSMRAHQQLWWIGGGGEKVDQGLVSCGFFRDVAGKVTISRW